MVRIGETRVPFRVQKGGDGVVQVDLGGEVLSVEGWPEGLEVPPGAVTVAGEVVPLEVLGRTQPSSVAPKVARSSPESRAPAERPVAGNSGDEAEDLPVPPPMPGKVIEVRVQEGQRVRRGEVLLVLEAMKMRNEVVSPHDGTVTKVAVKAGDNASAKQAMLFVRVAA